MGKQQHSIDGFVPRRTNSRIGERHDSSLMKANGSGSRSTRLHSKVSSGLLQRSHLGIVRADMDDSLRSIDTSSDHPKNKKYRQKAASRGKKRRRIVKLIATLVIVALLAIGGVLTYKALHASSSIFKGSILDIVQNQPLKQDANGRSNILVLGTSDDDPGHQGANLTDSMMILSIDQKNKNAYMISIPRDLWVQYGQACESGYAGKINVYYSCVGGSGGSDIDADRAALTKTGQFVGNIFGLSMQYGVNVNYTVMRDLVNAVGGSITITIQSRDPQGQMDSNFDWKCGVGDPKVSRAEVLQRCPPNGHYIDYPNGPAILDAEHALYLAQARGDSAPTYGFEQSNFDREKNQQKIVKAIRDKAVSTGVLTNFGRVTSIIDTLGNNLRTTFQTNEVQTLVSLTKNIPDNNIQSISLIDGSSPLMTTGMVDGQSVVEPSAGTYDYSSLQALMQQTLSSNPVIRENANVAVLNGSGVAGVAQTEANTLKGQGFNVGDIDDAPGGTYSPVTIYQIGNGMTATKAKLAAMFKVKVQTTTPPVTIPDGTNFVVILGKDPSTSN